MSESATSVSKSSYEDPNIYSYLENMGVDPTEADADTLCMAMW